MSRVRTERVGIAVLARAPVAGEAKTRLFPHLGAEGAAALHAALVRKALTSAVEAKLGEVTLWCAPDASHPFFASCRAELRIGLALQPPGDIGQRMLAAFAARRGPLLLVGSDCPMLSREHFRLCAAALRAGLDAVFLPAEDGGYGLIGLQRPIAGLFVGIEWGTERVMQQTRARLHAAALTWSEPATVWDVDRPEDVARLLEHDPQEWTPFFGSPAVRDGGLPPPKAG
jgi:rSAM/selenodomain-associated transferase 1